MELYLIRHGQSLNNALGDSTERVSDPPLTDKGEQQAALLAEHLKEGFSKEGRLRVAWGLQNRNGYEITRIFCSAMLRTLQTTAPVAKSLGIQPEVWPDVHEEGGIWVDEEDGKGPVGRPGLGRREILERFPGFVVPDDVPDDGWWNRPMETEAEWWGRARRVADRLRQEFSGSDERIALISHGAFMNNLLHSLFNNWALEGVYFVHQNTAITRVDIRDDRTMRVCYLNRLEYLPLELVT